MQYLAALARVALIAVAFATSSRIDAENLLLNPGVEQGKGAEPSVWSPASVPAPGLRMERTVADAKTGKAALMIANDHDYGEQVSNNWVQELPEPPRGATLRLRASIRTKNADAANVCLQCWSLNGESMLAFASTPVFRGDQDWVRTAAAAIVVPPDTASVLVRAALTGQGQAWFDDLEVTVESRDAGSQSRDQTPSVANNDGDERESGGGLEAMLRERNETVIKSISVTQDCMILSYMPQWCHGEIDNLAVANNQGGVRALFRWKPLPSGLLADPSHRVYVAAYSRETTGGKLSSNLRIVPLADNWPEKTSWESQPDVDETTEPATAEFQAGAGWKLFDVTALLKRSPRANRFGVALTFDNETAIGEAGAWSGYSFVSREALAEWRARRPRILVVASDLSRHDNK